MTYPPFYSQLQALIVAAMFICFAGAIVKPLFALIGYLILIIFRPDQVVSVLPFLKALRLELLIVLGIMLLTFLKGNFNNLSTDNTPLNKAMYAFFAVICLSVPQAYDISRSWDFFYSHYFNMFVFCIMMLTLADDEKDAKALVFTYLILVAWLTYLPIHNHMIGFGKFREGAQLIQSVGETFGVHSHVAQANLMSQTLPFAYFLFIGEKNPVVKLILVGFMALYVTANIVSGSRGGFVGLATCAMIFFLKAPNKFVAALAMAGVLFLATMLSPEYLNWISTILMFGDSDVSAQSRITGLINGIDICMRRPILGVGVGCFAAARKAWFGWGIWSHNLYGEVLGEIGLVGAAAWVFFIYRCFAEIAAIKKILNEHPELSPVYRQLADGCWAVLIVRLVLGMTTHSMFAYIWYFTAAVIIVLSSSIRKRVALAEESSVQLKEGIQPQTKTCHPLFVFPTNQGTNS